MQQLSLPFELPEPPRRQEERAKAIRGHTPLILGARYMRAEGGHLLFGTIIAADLMGGAHGKAKMALCGFPDQLLDWGSAEADAWTLVDDHTAADGILLITGGKAPSDPEGPVVGQSPWTAAIEASRRITAEMAARR